MQRLVPYKSNSKSLVNERARALGPPPLMPNGRFGMRLRYIASSALSTINVTWSSVQNLFYTCSSSPTIGLTSLYSSVKIDKVECWCPPLVSSSYTAPTPLVLRVKDGDPTGGIGVDKVVTDTATSMRGAYVSSRFKEIGGDWHDAAFNFTSGENVLFRLAGPAGTVVDLHCAFQIGAGIAYKSLTLAGGTVGVIYANYLDNTTTAGAAGTNLLVPDGNPQFTLKAANG